MIDIINILKKLHSLKAYVAAQKRTELNFFYIICVAHFCSFINKLRYSNFTHFFPLTNKPNRPEKCNQDYDSKICFMFLLLFFNDSFSLSIAVRKCFIKLHIALVFFIQQSYCSSEHIFLPLL